MRSALRENDARTIDAISRLAREDQIVLDLVNIPARETLRARTVELCW